jgi:hypothetical protein
MQMLDEIANAWGWRGLRPRSVVMQNEFGNVIFTDQDGQYWRICPEELSCEIVAADKDDFANLQNSSEFVEDWTMRALAEEARATLGAPAAARCYCLKIPAAVGGAYAIDNIGTIDRGELIAFSGNMARQIDGLPDGAQIELKVSACTFRAWKVRPGVGLRGVSTHPPELTGPVPEAPESLRGRRQTLESCGRAAWRFCTKAVRFRRQRPRETRLLLPASRV